MSTSLISILESFPGELFIETFAYLDDYHIYKAFYGLNSRLSTLALSTIVKHIDLRKVDFHECQKMFSVINRSRVIALKLSNNYSDAQIDQLFDNNLNHLCFLSLDAMKVLKIDSIIRRTDILYNLESLFIWFERRQQRDKVHSSSAWIFKTCSLHLKSLKYLSIRQHNDGDKQGQRAIDSSLSRSMPPNLSWQHLYFTTVCINRLGVILSSLSKLQTINATVELNLSTFVCPIMLYLYRCTLTLVRSSFESIVDFLMHCPNLQQLSLNMISTHTNALDDQQWQNVIERYLPQLKRFKIDMRTDPLALDVAERLCTTSFQNNSFWQERKTGVTVLERFSRTTMGEQVHIAIQFNIGIK